MISAFHVRRTRPVAFRLAGLCLLAWLLPAGPATAEDAKPVAAVTTPDDTPANRPALPADVPVPADPLAKAAFDVLAKHCSRCHQAGMLTSREKPAKNFGNILKLEETSADPHLIQAGNPEGSKLFQQVINKEMPYDLYYEFDTSHPEVSAADIEALRSWIKSTGDTEAKACAGRDFVGSQEIVAAIAADLQAQPAHRSHAMRYLTLSNLYNSCATEEAMEVYRQGAVKLLNGLGRRSDVVRVATVDAARTVLAFNLQDLGWSEAEWNTILARYPYATKPDVRLFDFIAKETETPLPYIRADWFAFNASQPPLYDALLRLPERYPDLLRLLNVDLESDIRNFVARRAGFQKSGVSQNNRLIERHPIATGYFWTSYDFSGSKGVQSLFLHPLGPGGENGFQHDGGESIFSLPNGFQAYYLNKADGTRLDKGPTQIVRDPSRRDLAVTNGISCMGCHDQGMRKAKDEVRAAVLADRSFKKAVRDEVAALYPETVAMDAAIEDDFQRFGAAMKRAGLDPTLKLNGVEMTNALYRRYEDDLSLRRAAAEYGFEPDAFKTAFIEAGPAAAALLRRLEQGIVPRDQFEALFGQFVEATGEDTLIDVSNLSGAAALAASVTPPAAGGTFALELNADQSSYVQGEAAVFTIVSSRDCNLFVVNVSKDGVGTVIFPNKFQAENAVKAGRPVTLGGPDSPFKFRLPDKGHEKVVAVCRVNGSTREAFGVSIDPGAEAFAEIKDFDRVVTRSIAVEANEARSKAEAIDPGAKAAAQFAKIASVTGSEAGGVAPQADHQTVASTAIVIGVK